MDKIEQVNETIHYIMIERDGSQPLTRTTMPKIQGRGRKPGSGCNMEFLSRMKKGDVAYPIPQKKVNSLRQSAHTLKIKIQLRQIPGLDAQYIIKRLT